MAESQAHDMQPKETVQQEYPRFTAEQRFQHIIILVTFTGLALTGLPQKFSDQAWAQTMIQVMGGIESIRIVHRIFATVLMAEAIYHGGIITYKLYVLGRRATMIPTIRDVRDVLQWIAFNLGLRKTHPYLPRYNFGEKAEYLALVWGTIVMVVTGLCCGIPSPRPRYFPAK